MDASVLDNRENDLSGMSESVWYGLLPKSETEAQDFISSNPRFDGRGIIVGILDTGVDPGAIGLSKTSDGKVKVIDIIDCSGSNDVIMGPLTTPTEGYLIGSTGRKLYINSNWKNPTGQYRVGSKRVYELLPKEVTQRIKTHRDEKVTERKKQIEAALLAESQNPGNEGLKDDYKLRISQLNSIKDDFEDPGPVYDCIVYHDGDRWQAVVDTTETGDMSTMEPMTDYRHSYQYKRFSDVDAMNYCVNIIDNGDILSVVTDVTPHGSHVAGIVSAYYPDQPECNGVAPGAQIISLKIGDTRLGSMETGASLTRALIEAVKRGCHIINISYGEAVAWDNYGDFVSLANELVYEHGVIIVSSAGNNGPALSTVGCPGGTSSSVIGVAALCTESLMKVAYSYSKELPTTNYTWSSVGPTIDGDLGVNIIAPGGAVTSVSNWTLNKRQLMNGTSMSSPNATGCITLLLSAAKASGFDINPTKVRRAIENSATFLDGIIPPAQGSGLVQVSKAWELYQSLTSHWVDIPMLVTIQSSRFARGIYLRQPYETSIAHTFKAELEPYFHKNISADRKFNFEIRIKLVPTAEWITCNEYAVLYSAGKVISIQVDPSKLSPGLYCEFVRVFDETRSDLGPVCSIPITVTKPNVLPNATTELNLGVMSFEPGHVERKYIVPPYGCQYIDAVIRDMRHEVVDESSDSSVSTLVLHAIQLFKGVAYRDNEKDNYIFLQPGSVQVISWPVYDSWTMELVLARSWASVTPTKFEVTLHFQGVQPDPSQIFISGGSRVSPQIKLFSHIRDVEVLPSGKLDRWITTIRPNTGKVLPLGERDVLLDGSRYYQLVLEYDFELNEKSSVVPRWPSLQGVLYESDFTGQLFMIYDSKKKLVGKGDSWPSFTTLSKGSYKVFIQIRHRSLQMLESLVQTPMLLERKLSSSISLQFYRTQSEALIGKDQIKSRAVVRDGMTSCYVREPSNESLSKVAKNGDIFVGSVTYLKKQENVHGSGTRPGGYTVRYCFSESKPTASGNSSSKSSSASNDGQSMADAIKDGKIRYLGSLTGKNTFIATYEELVAEYSIDKQLRKLLISHATNVLKDIETLPKNSPMNPSYSYTRRLVEYLPRDESTLSSAISSLLSIMSWYDWIVKDMDESLIASKLGVNADPDDANSSKEKRDAESDQSILIDAACLKGKSAIILMEMISVGVGGSETTLMSYETYLEILQTCCKAVQKWDDITSKESYWPLYFHQLKRSNKLGTALKKLSSMLAGNPIDRDHLYMDQLSVISSLGWDHVIDVVKMLAALETNAQYLPF